MTDLPVYLFLSIATDYVALDKVSTLENIHVLRFRPKWLVANVAEALGISTRSLEKLKKRLVKEALPDAIERKKPVTPPREIQFGGDFEAKRITLACMEPPEGRKRWTVRLLAEKLVEWNIVPSVSPITVCNILKKTNLRFISADTGKSHRIIYVAFVTGHFGTYKICMDYCTPILREDMLEKKQLYRQQKLLENVD